ncbi:hypothetical protein [Paenibacillus lutrae]|uniref:Uncharacterized protein n=1 Tax=Paenibacillus lutrae TaxID=2078573 RepID=A0A7X3FHG4_9BACL|nr:hypothetical protein [Paenibacillus lutrae]MVO99696.1 hypothetical protein [Paenibacillus lutrae]
MDEDLIKLIVPILISLILTIIISVRSIRHGSLKPTLLYTALINGVILLIGFLWLWMSTPDGLAQLAQAGIYGIAFVFILVINIAIVLIGKKKSF